MEYRAVTIPYYMDDMRLSELMTITDDLEYIDRNSWEQTRLSCLISAQKASKKRLKLKDIFTLPWDNIEQDEEDIKKQLEQTQYLENILNNIQQ